MSLGRARCPALGLTLLLLAIANSSGAASDAEVLPSAAAVPNRRLGSKDIKVIVNEFAIRDIKVKDKTIKADSTRRRKLSKSKSDGGDSLQQLQKEVKQMQLDKNVLSNQVKASEHNVLEKANRIAELTAEVAKGRDEVSKLNNMLSERTPTDAALKQAKEEAAQSAKLAAQVAAQQKDIAKLTSQLSALRIKYQDLQLTYGDPSLKVFLSAKATKVYHHPGIQGAANMTYKYVLPKVAEALEKGTEMYVSLNASVHESLLNFVEDTPVEPWVPAVSGFLIYGMICLPLGISLTCLAEIVCKLPELLLACSFYLNIMSVMSVAFILHTGKDPLHELAEHDPTVYLLQQAGFAIIVLLYTGLLILAACISDGSNWDVTARCIQLTLVGIFCLVYYQLVWTPAMIDEMPLLDDFMAQYGSGRLWASIPYALATVGFCVNTILERMILSKKEEVEEQEKEYKDA